MPPVVITTPFPGGERIAELLGVSPARARRLIALAKESLREENGLVPAPSQSERPHVSTKTKKRKKKARR